MLEKMCTQDLIDLTIKHSRNPGEGENVLKDLYSAVDEFNKVCWSDIVKANEEEKEERGFTFVTDTIKFLTFYTAGRILITMVRPNEDFDYVSLCGAPGQGTSGECGLQGIYMEMDRAVELVKSVTSQWDVSKYVPDSKVSLCV